MAASSLLGANPASYTETQEASNAARATAEQTGYTLEAVNGLAIHGTFEASAASSDSFIFNSGTFGGASAPDFPGVDMQLVIDGKVVRENTPLSLSLDSVASTGYSGLSGGTYFTNAALLRNHDYVITVAPFAPGKSYTLQVRGHVASP